MSSVKQISVLTARDKTHVSIGLLTWNASNRFEAKARKTLKMPNDNEQEFLKSHNLEWF
jgi:hypothetical protein